MIADAILIGSVLVVGVPCLVTPRPVRALVLKVNEHMGYVEPLDGFRRSAKYLRLLRLVGASAILGAMVIAFAGDFVHFVI